MDKGKTKVKVDEEEALTASQTRTPRTRTRPEATLIQGGTPSPLGDSLVRPHAHKRRPSKNKGLSVSMKAVMTVTLRREAFS